MNRTGYLNKRGGFLYKVWRWRALFVLMLPAIVVLLINNYIPMLGAIIAFKNIKYSYPGFMRNLIESPWVGFRNFEFLFKSGSAWQITRNTLLYNFGFMAGGTIIAVFFAVMINEITDKKLAKIYQNIIFLPYFISYVGIASCVYAFLSSEYGLVNRTILPLLGLKPVDWYSQYRFWPLILNIVCQWKWAGYNSVMYLAAISGIDQTYYEAAVIDGATHWQRIRYITLPMLKPFIIIINLLALGRIFYSDFGLFFQTTMNSGMLYPSTLVIDTYVYNALATTGDFGMSAAAGFYQALVGFVLVLSANLLVRKVSPENAMF
jgi:putative aldouronate transport system permease protein